MKRRLLVLALLLAPFTPRDLSAQAQVQQQSARKLEPTTASAEARSAFWAALDANNNIFALRARASARTAVSLDPSFGLARALMAVTAVELTTAQRNEELDRAVSDAARATTGELLFAAAIRANALGRPDETRALLDAATALLPNDPHVAYFRALVAPAGQAPGPIREVTRKFPEYAPAFNTLAYQLWAAGDRAGAMEAVQSYVRLAPTHPNSHDSYAELLQFSGRLPDALQHYQAAARLDSAFDQAYAGMGEVHMLMGHGEVARASYMQAADRAPTPAAKINSLGARATTYLIDGKPKDALRELASVGSAAEQQNLRPQAAAAYRAIALIEAAFGDRKAVPGALAKAAELGGPDVPAQHRVTALAYALTGELDQARAAATKFRDAAATGPVGQQNNAREVNAVIAVAERDLAKAQAELAQAGAAPLGRAVLAEALKKSGRKAEADALRTEILNAGTASVFDVVARTKASKI